MADMNLLNELAGLKEDDLLKLGNCQVCGKQQLEGGEISFYKIEITRAGFDARALKRRLGLEMQMGNAMLARHMGPNEDLAKIIDGPHTVFVHESCAAKIHHLLELIPESKDGDDAEDDTGH